jgi:hypothetical protein
MKLVVIYNLFDGIELLEYAAKQIRQYCDRIIVHYQNNDYYGKPIPEPVEPVLNRLKAKNIIDEAILFDDFVPATNWREAKSNELRKRVIIKKLLLDTDFTHYLESDVDEFYVGEEFNKAKKLIEDNNYVTTSTDAVDYVYSPTLRKDILSSTAFPFICKLMPIPCGFPIKNIDPTRITAGDARPYHHFALSDVTMHHMETIRKNLLLKYQATSRGILDRNRLKTLSKIIQNAKSGDYLDLKGIMYPDRFKIIKCTNQFNIPEFSLMNQKYEDDDIEQNDFLIITSNIKDGTPDIYINHKHPSIRFGDKPINK